VLRLAFLNYALNPFAALYRLPSRVDSLLLGAALVAVRLNPDRWSPLAKFRPLVGWLAAVFGIAFVTVPFGRAR